MRRTERKLFIIQNAVSLVEERDREIDRRRKELRKLNRKITGIVQDCGRIRARVAELEGRKDEWESQFSRQLDRIIKLEAAIKEHRAQPADDRCMEDDDKLYAVLGDGIKCDRRVGDKFEMVKNCVRFIEQRCEEGGWPTYAEIKEKLDEFEHLFELQHKRVTVATQVWRAETGQHDILPDLGKLVEWLMVKAGLIGSDTIRTYRVRICPRCRRQFADSGGSHCGLCDDHPASIEISVAVDLTDVDGPAGDFERIPIHDGSPGERAFIGWVEIKTNRIWSPWLFQNGLRFEGEFVEGVGAEPRLVAVSVIPQEKESKAGPWKDSAGRVVLNRRNSPQVSVWSSDALTQSRKLSNCFEVRIKQEDRERAFIEPVEADCLMPVLFKEHVTPGEGQIMPVIMHPAKPHPEAFEHNGLWAIWRLLWVRLKRD